MLSLQSTKQSLQRFSKALAPCLHVYGFSTEIVLWFIAVIITTVSVAVWRFHSLGAVDVALIYLIMISILWFGRNSLSLRLFVWSLIVVVALTIALMLYGHLPELPSARQLIQGWMWLILLVCVLAVGRHFFAYTEKWLSLPLWLSLLLSVLVFLLRWYESWLTGTATGQIPLTQHDDVMLLLLSIMTGLVLYDYRWRRGGPLDNWVFLPLAIFAALVLVFPASSTYGLNLPILQLFWLKLHVPAMVLAYAALILAGMLGLGVLCSYKWGQQGIFREKAGQLYIDSMYRLLSLGILALSVGLLAGLFWSDRVWGHYLLWEPKQIGAIALWFYYLAALHLRLNRHRQSVALAWWLLAGVAMLLFVAFGVDALGVGQHFFITV